MSSEPLRASCPACRAQELSGSFQRTDQPLTLNYRCVSVAQAKSMGGGILNLRECEQCGLIFNAAFQAERVCYDESYDNRQGFSNAFRHHVELMATALTNRYLVDGGKVLEIGCGKGDFLRVLRDMGWERCVGYDTSCPENGEEDDRGIEYHQSYVSADDIDEEFDLVVCRHVVEHVDEIGDFVSEVARIAKSAGGAAVAIETPEFEWIVNNRCFWDVFYEHCNYFSMPVLARLCEGAGFEVLRHQKVFGEQYQLIELRPRATTQVRTATVSTGLLASFAESTDSKHHELREAIGLGRESAHWAIWGAGAKGVTLCNLLGDEHLSAVIDSNTEKQGGYIPGVGMKVIPPDEPMIKYLGLILIANPIYEAEIRKALIDVEYSGNIVVA